MTRLINDEPIRKFTNSNGTTVWVAARAIAGITQDVEEGTVGLWSDSGACLADLIVFDQQDVEGILNWWKANA